MPNDAYAYEFCPKYVEECLDVWYEGKMLFDFLYIVTGG